MIIYVVDDHQMMLDATVSAIGHLSKNATIRAFSSFEQFLSAVQNANPPHLIFLDLNLPNIKEYEGIKIARSECPHAKIAIYSAYPAKDRAQQCLASGADVYLEKSNGINDLKKCLGMVCITRPVMCLHPEL